MDMTGYTKLFGSIIASTIWREPHTVRIVWITMLAMANKDGVVEASVPGLADLARVTVDECRSAIAALQDIDPDSRSTEHDGRRIAKQDGGWLILNHAKYRAKMGVDERREYLRLKQKEHREKKSVNNRNDSSTESTHAEEDSYSEADSKAPSISIRQSADLFTDTGFEATNSKPNKAKGTKEEVIAYCLEEQLTSLDGEAYFAIKESKGWKDVKDWKAQIRAWKLQRYHPSQKQGYSKPADEPYLPRDDV